MRILIKNKAIVIAALLMVGIIGIGSTYAFLTDQTKIVENTFTMASDEVNTSLIENVDDSVIDKNIYLLKQPYVSNDGPGLAIVRARITISPSDADVTLYKGTWEGKSFTPDQTIYSADTGYVSFVDQATGKGWIYKDGWYYYNTVTSNGTDEQYTETLFDAVVLLDGVDADDEIEITVYEESVYSGGRTAGTIISADEIDTLFKENM